MTETKKSLSILEEGDIELEIYDLCEEYIQENICFYFRENFQEKMTEEIHDYMFKESVFQKWSVDDLREWIEIAVISTLEIYDIPARQCLLDNDNQLLEKETCKLVIEELEKKTMIKQRTEEWYRIRHNCFSASNIWKVFDSLAQKNSLIYEKCNPPKIFHSNHQNKPNAMNWGIKYEPVSIQIYEHKHPKTKVNTNYGCILHRNYPFIGASPDGINISEEDSAKYGRMVEVKNIYNREITGIPLEEYWIQMQMQMEVCELSKCDFLETRFKEFETETDFYLDILTEYKGVILFFLQKSNTTTSFYEYMPLYISQEKEHIDKWIQSQQEKYQEEYVLYEKIYWKLDEYSCVLVERNPAWFESALPLISETWKIVEEERKHGFEHRAPRKNKKLQIDSFPSSAIIITEKEEISNTIKVIKLE